MGGWNILIFGVIPVFTVAITFIVKRKVLWVAPLLSTALAFITYMIAFRLQGMHSPAIKIFSNNEWRAFFLLAMFMHLGIVVLLLAGVLFMAKNSISFSTGSCIAADNGRYLIVMDNSPVSMHQRSGKKSIFPDLDTGDRIFIVHDGVAESYPGKTGVYLILKLSDGDISDVPEEIIDELQEMGWISR